MFLLPQAPLEGEVVPEIGARWSKREEDPAKMAEDCEDGFEDAA